MATKIWDGTDTGNEGNWSVAANWSPSGVPTNGDDVILEDSSQGVTGGLDQSAVALASLDIKQSYTGAIGSGSAPLQIGASTGDIGKHLGPGLPAGSGDINLALGSTTACTLTIHNTGTPSNSGEPAVKVTANNASTVIHVRKGKVGIAIGTSETSTVGTINVSYTTSVAGDADVYIGSGVTLTNLNVTGGDVVQSCGATTVKVYAGALVTSGSGAIATMTVTGGSVESNSTGLIGALTVSDAGVVDFLKSMAARTVTTVKLNRGGTIKRDPNVVTFTNGLESDEPVILTAA